MSDVVGNGILMSISGLGGWMRREGGGGEVDGWDGWLV